MQSDRCPFSQQEPTQVHVVVVVVFVVGATGSVIADVAAIHNGLAEPNDDS